jgi:hypothetical protein
MDNSTLLLLLLLRLLLLLLRLLLRQHYQLAIGRKLQPVNGAGQ